MCAAVMSKKMRLLIGYDGSDSADASLEELGRAGLTQKVEALILVDNVWLPSTPSEFARALSARRMLASETSSFVPALRTVEEGRALSREALRRARSLFPDWDVRVEVSPNLGLPASELIRKAFSWDADLIVVGSDAPLRSAAGFKGGDASRKVIAEAPCSVRLARTKSRAARGPVRLIVAVDGSPWVMNAVRAIAAREWPEGSECRLVETGEVAGELPGALDLREKARESDLSDTENYSRNLAERTVRSAGLRVSNATGKGSLHNVLIEEAHGWGADCVFIGTHERESTLGNDAVRLAALLASSSPCSVELSRSVKREPEHEYLPLIRVTHHSSSVGAV